MEPEVLSPPTFEVIHPRYGAHSYTATPKQLEFHTCTAPHCILEGTRGTGKSVAIRNDAHLRAMQVPGLVYLIIRRTMPELRKTHLKFIHSEMQKLGGHFNKTESIAYYPNGSQGFFAHCETEDDMMKLLGGDYVVIYFDEMTTFSREQITKIGTCARVPEGSGLMALIRGGTNPIGVGAEYVLAYYVNKDVDPEDDGDYDPTEYVAIHTIMGDNPHIDVEQYVKKFSGLPEHIRRAWLDGEWISEGAYFADFRPKLGEQHHHVIPVLPRVEGKYLLDVKWLRIYRAVDWGFFPDPAVCLWMVVLPDSRVVVFQERTWFRTRAADVAIDIKEASDGMRIAETFCDPTMFDGSDATGHSVGDIFEMNGVPLTPSVNNRKAAGYAVHEYLNTLVEGIPKLQILNVGKSGCQMLVKTFPTLRMDKHDPRKIADGNDHWVIALAYFCMTLVGPSKAPYSSYRKPWMVAKKSTRPRLGAESVRAAIRH